MAEVEAVIPVSQPRAIAMLVEFDDVDAALEGAARVRDAGYTQWDTHTPFPVHGMNEAMGLKPTLLQWVVLGAGLTGFAFAVWLQWWMNAVDYPYVISGKPIWSIPANVPVMFELTVLFSGLTTFLGMFAFNRMPAFYHEVFHSERFEQHSTTDRYYISVLASDPKFDERRTAELLSNLPQQTFFEVLSA